LRSHLIELLISEPTLKSISFCILAVTIAVLTHAPKSSAQSADVLSKCRAIKEPTERLACYDAIDVKAVEAKPTSAVAATAVTATKSADKVSDAASIQANAQAEFGLHVPTEADKLKKIESRIVGAFNGWGPNSWITLENGQVWQVQDDTRRPLELDSPKVTVERGMLGAFYMVIAGTNHSPRVKRVR
jgi:hypothetical protein